MTAPADTHVSDAELRIAAYLLRRTDGRRMYGDDVHTLDEGCPTEARVTMTDLTSVLHELSRLRSAIEEIERALAKRQACADEDCDDAAHIATREIRDIIAGLRKTESGS